ncbi:MAG: GNAT family N-acetyltransferase [Longimicrobiales bacterium]
MPDSIRVTESSTSGPTSRSTTGRTIRIDTPASVAEWNEARALVHELVAWLIQTTPLDFDAVVAPMLREIELLADHYSPPGACLLLGHMKSEPAGVTAVRILEPGIAELKRVWVRPHFRNMGLASRLLDCAFIRARAMGALSLRLETSPSIMPRAHAMYLNRGFQPIPHYSELERHASDVVAMELRIE